jgi:polyisoprenoid-binding protein YceI
VNKILLIFLILINFDALSQSYSPNNAQSSISFKIKNLGITVDGSFAGLNGTINFDPSQLSSSKFEVAVDAASIDTGIELRNKHLKKEEYFDVKTYPQIKFVSTKIETGSEGKFTVNGKLTIKNITKEIKFDFTTTRTDGGLLFVGEFPLNRRDYKVGGGSFSMADELKVFLSVATNKN